MQLLRRSSAYPPGLSQSAGSFCDLYKVDIEWLRKHLGRPDITPEYVLTDDEAHTVQHTYNEQKGIYSPTEPEEGTDVATKMKFKELGKENRQASTVLTAFPGLATLDELKSLAGLEQISARTPFSPDLQQTAKNAYIVQREMPLELAVEVLADRRIIIPLGEAIKQTGKGPDEFIHVQTLHQLAQHNGTVPNGDGPTSPQPLEVPLPVDPDADEPSAEIAPVISVSDMVLKVPSRPQPRSSDHKIVKDTLQPFVERYRAVQLPFVPALWQEGSYFAYISPVTDKKIKIDLPQKSEYDRVGNYPVITQNVLREMAGLLGDLWCVSYKCRHCGEAIDPRVESKLKLVMAGRFELPLIGAFGQRIKFPSQHDECRLLMQELVRFELEEMDGFQGTEEEAIEFRVSKYRKIAGQVLPDARQRQSHISMDDLYRRLEKMLDLIYGKQGER